MKKSILITGNAGLLGSRMADWMFIEKRQYDTLCL